MQNGQQGHVSHLSLTLSTVTLSILLAACGSGGSGNASNSGSDSAGTTPVITSTTLSGVAVDGYLSQAKVCLDLNDNGICDAGEPTTQTDGKGKYTLQAPNLDAANNHHILIEVVGGVTVDTDSPSAPVASGYTLTAPIGLHGVISPISTLIHAWKQMYPGISHADLMEVLRQKIGFSRSLDLTADFAYVNATDEQKVLHNLARALPIILNSDLQKIEVALGHPLTATEKQQATSLIYSRLWNWLPSIVYLIDSGIDANQIPNLPALASLFDTTNIATQLTPASVKGTQILSPVTSLSNGFSFATAGYYINGQSSSMIPHIFSYEPQAGSTSSRLGLLSMHYQWNPTTANFSPVYDGSGVVLNNGRWVTDPGFGSEICNYSPIALGLHVQCDSGFEADENWYSMDLSGVNINGYLLSLFSAFNAAAGQSVTSAWKISTDRVFSKGAMEYRHLVKVTKDYYRQASLSFFTGPLANTTFTTLDSAMQAASTSGSVHYHLGGILEISFDNTAGSQGNLSLYLRTPNGVSSLPMKGTWNRSTIGQTDIVEFTVPDVYQRYSLLSPYLRKGWTLYQGQVKGVNHELPGTMFVANGLVNPLGLNDLKTNQGSAH